MAVDKFTFVNYLAASEVLETLFFKQRTFCLFNGEIKMVVLEVLGWQKMKTHTHVMNIYKRMVDGIEQYSQFLNGIHLDKVANSLR